MEGTVVCRSRLGSEVRSMERATVQWRSRRAALDELLHGSSSRGCRLVMAPGCVHRGYALSGRAFCCCPVEVIWLTGPAGEASARLGTRRR